MNRRKKNGNSPLVNDDDVCGTGLIADLKADNQNLINIVESEVMEIYKSVVDRKKKFSSNMSKRCAA